MNRIGTFRDEQGLALPLALMLLVLVSGLSLAFLSMSGLEVVIAQNHDGSKRAFHIAEAGIEHALSVLPKTDIGKLLGNGGTLFNALALGAGTYSVNVSDNGDGTYFVSSTGTYKTASRTLRALVRGAGMPPPLGAAEALVDPTVFRPVNQESKTEFDAEPGGSFDGRDWNAPADLSTCTNIANCGTLLSAEDNPSTHGGFTNNSDNITQVANGGTIVGSNCSPPACGTNARTVSTKTDSTVEYTRWDGFLAAAIPQADRTVTAQGASSALSGVQTWGTAAAPEITVLNIRNANTFGWNATVKGAGVLIIEIENSAALAIRGTGDLNWQGLVIVRSAGSVEFEVGKQGGGLSGGISRIFGQVVNRSAAYAEIEFENQYSFIKYSSAALNLVRGKLFSVQGWQEVAE
jgi:hypothetical protein